MSVAAATGSQDLWFVSRGSGLVLLVLFSVVVALGAATRMGSAPRRWPRFAVAELHRTLSLFAVALLGLHVVTAILDPYVTIRPPRRPARQAGGRWPIRTGREPPCPGCCPIGLRAAPPPWPSTWPGTARRCRAGPIPPAEAG